MATRRDTELTLTEQTLFSQLRGLFRHAPLNKHDFANLAPNVAETLSPNNRLDALDVFWDVLDAQERDKRMEALFALLGMTDFTDNVLHRKTAFNADVNPRTVSRWADTALSQVVRYIMATYAERSAFVTLTALELGYTLELRTNVDMGEPYVADLEGVIDAPLASEAEWHQVIIDFDYFRQLLQVTWDGPIWPIFQVANEIGRPLLTQVAHSTLYVHSLSGRQ